RGAGVALRRRAFVDAAGPRGVLVPLLSVPWLLVSLLSQARPAGLFAGGPLHAHGAAPPRLGHRLWRLHLVPVVAARPVRLRGHGDAERAALPGGLRAGVAGPGARDPGYAPLGGGCRFPGGGGQGLLHRLVPLTGTHG